MKRLRQEREALEIEVARQRAWLSDNDTVPEELVSEPVAKYQLTYEWGNVGFIYFLVSCGRVVYVGQTVSLSGRIGSHIREGVKDFSEVWFLTCATSELSMREKQFIKRLHPPYNKTHLPIKEIESGS